MPRRRVWLYLKRWKRTSLLHEGTVQRGHMNNSAVEGPEDVIARGESSMDTLAMLDILLFYIFPGSLTVCCT